MNDAQLKIILLKMLELIVKESDIHSMTVKMSLIRFENLEAIVRMDSLIATMEKDDPDKASAMRQQLNALLPAFEECAKMGRQLKDVIAQGESIRDQLLGFIRDALGNL